MANLPEPNNADDLRRPPLPWVPIAIVAVVVLVVAGGVVGVIVGTIWALVRLALLVVVVGALVWAVTTLGRSRRS